MKIPENFDRWMFDYKEGNLSPEEAEAFENFLVRHPEYEVDMDAWDQAFITSQPVIYPDAHKLEKKRRVGGWYMWSAAAALFLLLGTTALFVLSGNDDALLAGTKNKTSFVNPGSAVMNGNPENNAAVVNQSGDLITHANEAFNGLTGGLFNPFIDMNANQVNGSTTGSHTSQAAINSGATQSGEPVQSESLVTNSTTSADFVGGGTTVGLVNGELAKLHGNEHNAKYNGNPDSKNLGFDVSKKTVSKYKPISSKMKKLYHNIEKSLRYPVGLANLRDPELLLPQTNILAFNPAFAGGMLRSRFDMSYRTQWWGTEMASQELNISFDKYSSQMRGGVGILVNAQDYGMGKFGDYNVSLFYSPKFAVSKNVMIEPSVKMTMGTLVANGDKLNPNASFEMDRGRAITTIDAAEMNGMSQLWYKDYGLGLMINTKWFYAGFSADNLAGHYENVYGNDLSSPSQSPVKMTAVIGTDKVKKDQTFSASPFLAYQQYGNQPEVWGGVNMRMHWFVLGASANTNKEFTASAGIKLDKFKLVYRYDMTESVVMDDYFGSHSIGIRFNAEKKNRLIP
jgi:type IX secretion system PorP/SprF family membrane protein